MGSGEEKDNTYCFPPDCIPLSPSCSKFMSFESNYIVYSKRGQFIF